MTQKANKFWGCNSLVLHSVCNREAYIRKKAIEDYFGKLFISLLLISLQNYAQANCVFEIQTGNLVFFFSSTITDNTGTLANAETSQHSSLVYAIQSNGGSDI